MIIKKQFIHQSLFCQAPYLYENINFFFLLGGYGCVHGDTLIETTKGTIKIRDFDGGEVLTFDKNRQKITTQYAKKAIKQGTAPLYEVETNEGKKILVTRSHQFLTPTGYVSLEDLSVGDSLIAYNLQASKITSIEYKGYFDYYDLHVPVYNNYLAEGMIHHNCGKTSALVDATIKAIKYFAGKKDMEGKNPKIGICGITLTFLKKTFSGALIQVFDSTKTLYNYDKANNIIYVAGVELHLTGIYEEKDIFGFDWCAALVDELDELETYKAINVVKSINERCRQRIAGKRAPFLAFATTSQGLKGTYQVVHSLKKSGVGYVLIRGRTKDNTYLDKKKVAELYKMYSPKEVECYLEGKFVSVDSGKPYPDYDPVKCKTEYDLFDSVQPEETVYIGQDFNSGFNKAVALIVRDGIIYIIKEYSFPDLRSAPKVMRYDFPKNVIKWIPDATGSEKVMLFRKELRAHGIRVMMRKKNPMIADRIFLINKLFYTGRMYVCPFCKNLDNDLIIRQNDPKSGLPMKGTSESAPDHLCDSLEYAVTYMVQWLKELKDIYSVTLGRRLQHRIEAGLVNEKDAAYAQDIEVSDEIA